MTSRAYSGIKDVYYIHVLDSEHHLLQIVGPHDSFPDSTSIERALVVATGIYGFGCTAKIDKRYELNLINNPSVEPPTPM